MELARRSMEFHGTFKVNREVPWNSLELWKFHGTWCQHQIPWNSMESPPLEQKFHGIPWNCISSMEFGYITKFHGIPWNHCNQLRSSMEFHGFFKSSTKFGYITKFHIPIPGWEVPWNSMELSRSIGKFHGTLKVPWNLMPTPNSMEFHGTATPRTKVPWNSMEF